MNAGEVAFFRGAGRRGYPDAHVTTSRRCGTARAPSTAPRWKSADYDKVIDEAQATGGQRQALRRSIIRPERILIDDWGTAPLPLTANARPSQA